MELRQHTQTRLGKNAQWWIKTVSTLMIFALQPLAGIAPALFCAALLTTISETACTSALLTTLPDEPRPIAVGPPLGTKHAWRVDYSYTFDASKIAAEQGGKVYIVQIVPPRISNGTSQKQEVTATLVADDGTAAKLMRTTDGQEALVLQVNSASGKATLKLTGVIYDRDMRNITDGSVELSKVDQDKYTRGYKGFDIKAEGVKPALQSLGLIKEKDETDSAFVERVCLWLAKNKNAIGHSDAKIVEAHPEEILFAKSYFETAANACLTLILRANGVACKINPQMALLFNDASFDSYNVLVYLSDRKLWTAVNACDIIYLNKDAIQNDSVVTSGCYGLDCVPRDLRILVDMDNDIGHAVVIPGVCSYSSFFDSPLPRWAKAGRSGDISSIQNNRWGYKCHKMTSLDYTLPPSVE